MSKHRKGLYLLGNALVSMLRVDFLSHNLDIFRIWDWDWKVMDWLSRGPDDAERVKGMRKSA